MNPTPLRSLDLSRHGKTILMRVVTDEGILDLSLRNSHALTMGNALTEYAQQ